MAKNAPLLVAIDDGYAQTKVYGAPLDGDTPVKRVFRTSLRTGKYGLRRLGGEGSVDAYKVEEGNEYTVSDDVEAENTQFDGFHLSPMNRVFNNHGLFSAGYGGREVDLITGLPVNDFFSPEGGINAERIDAKKQNLLKRVERTSSQDPMAVIRSVDVGCQAVAAWWDYTFGDDLKARKDLKGRVAIVDIGGRTTDIAVVVNGSAVDSALSGTKNSGVLDVYKALNASIQRRFGIRDMFPLAYLDEAVRTGRLEVFGTVEDVTENVKEAVLQVEDDIAREIDRRIGSSLATLKAVVFTGGGGALFQGISKRFKNGSMIEDPEFANARGLYKFARFRASRASKAA